MALALHLVGLTLLASYISGGPNENNEEDGVKAKTGRVAVDFMGASGGMKIRNVESGMPDRWVMLKQNKLEELAPNGSKVCHRGRLWRSRATAHATSTEKIGLPNVLSFRPVRAINCPVGELRVRYRRFYPAYWP